MFGFINKTEKERKEKKEKREAIFQKRTKNELIGSRWRWKWEGISKIINKQKKTKQTF
jgi:hypothetical protein